MKTPPMSRRNPLEKIDPEKLTDEEKEDVIRDLYETNFRVYDRLAEI